MSIYSNFNKLKEDKKRKILSVAMKEFYRHGFEKTSTNEICKKAEISKGALFNYFNSKKDLYIYLVEFSLEVINHFYEDIDVSERDLFKRLENIGLQKLYMQKNNPHVFDFLTSLNKEKSKEVLDFIKSNFSNITTKGLSRIYDNIDYSKFRDDLDVKKAIEILNWTMFAFSEKSIQSLESFKNLEEEGSKFLEEWHDYSNILKRCFYK